METTLLGAPLVKADYTLQVVGDCVLVYGNMPIDAFSRITKMLHEKAVVDPRVAKMAGANLAMGLKKDLAELTEILKPASLTRHKSLFRDTNLSEAAINWLAAGERGASSDALFQHLTGVKIQERHSVHTDHPHDPDDLRRCMLLLDQCPELQAQLHKMRDVSPEWEALVDAWPALILTFNEEAPNWRDPDATWRAPKTYNLMKQALSQ